jgi:hypothetical protein
MVCFAGMRAGVVQPLPGSWSPAAYRLHSQEILATVTAFLAPYRESI